MEVQQGETPAASDLPIALGVIRNVEADTYDQAVSRQIEEVRSRAKASNFDALTQTLETWKI